MDDPSTGVIPVSQHSPTWRDMVSALRVRNYRYYAIGQLFSVTAVWMQRITQDWLLFELTGNVTAVGLLVVMQFGPVLLFGLWGGVIVDRYSKRMLIMGAQVVVVIVGVTLAALALTGVIEAWHVFVLAGVVGIVTVVDQPARQVFVSELVGRQTLRNAVSTNSAIFQTARLIGPALSGIMIVSVGSGWAFACTALGGLISIATLSMVNTRQLSRSQPTPPAKGQVREALAYARRKPVIFWTLTLLTFVASIGVNWPVLLTPIADGVFYSGAQGYGSYNSAIAAGALVGAILSMRRRNLRLRTFVFAVIGMMVFKLLAGIAPVEWVFMVLLSLTGMWAVLMWTAANSLVQVSSNMLIRGRIMSLYLLIAAGGQAIGGPALGVLVDLWGARTGMIISAVIPLLAAIVVALIIARTHKLTLSSVLPWRRE